MIQTAEIILSMICQLFFTRLYFVHTNIDVTRPRKVDPFCIRWVLFFVWRFQVLILEPTLSSFTITLLSHTKGKSEPILGKVNFCQLCCYLSLSLPSMHSLSLPFHFCAGCSTLVAFYFFHLNQHSHTSSLSMFFYFFFKSNSSTMIIISSYVPLIF